MIGLEDKQFNHGAQDSHDKFVCYKPPDKNEPLAKEKATPTSKNTTHQVPTTWFMNV